MDEKLIVPVLPVKERIDNFKEVEKTISFDTAKIEANRCLQCKKPLCQINGCPVHNRIPEFINCVKENKIDEAYKILLSTHIMPGVCSRVCNKELQCEGSCIRGIKGNAVSIGALERYVADNTKIIVDKVRCKKKQKIAIVGGGPAGISCAKILSIEGYDVTIFEKNDKIGGVLRYGIPKYRLPEDVLDKEVAQLEQLNIKVINNNEIKSEKELVDYDAVFISIGATKSMKMNVPGENNANVLNGIDFLEKINKDSKIEIGNKALVIGGGNVAIDSARSALRLGANVTIIYRREECDMPASKVEISFAKEEGVEFEFLTKVKEITAKGVKCVKLKIDDSILDDFGKRKILEIPNSEFEIATDSVIVAIGQRAFQNIFDIENDNGRIIVDCKTQKTSEENVYAGGDVVTGANTVISAINAGQKAAKAISEYFG